MKASKAKAAFLSLSEIWLGGVKLSAKPRMSSIDCLSEASFDAARGEQEGEMRGKSSSRRDTGAKGQGGRLWMQPGFLGRFVNEGP